MTEEDVRTALRDPLDLRSIRIPKRRAEDGRFPRASPIREPGVRFRGFWESTCGRKSSSLSKRPIRKMTSRPATRVGLSDRGILRPGMAADVTIFDPETIRDVSTFEDPNHYSVGVRYVLVNGARGHRRGKDYGGAPGTDSSRTGLPSQVTDAPAMPAIVVDSLQKTYPGTRKSPPVEAVKGISFEVETGEFFGLLGPNGAGKSTTLGCITTLVRPTSGRVLVDGIDVRESPAEAKRRIAVVPQNRNLDSRSHRARDPDLPWTLFRTSRGGAGVAREPPSRRASCRGQGEGQAADPFRRPAAAGHDRPRADARPESARCSTSPPRVSTRRRVASSGKRSASFMSEAFRSFSPRTIWRRPIDSASGSPSSITERILTPILPPR